MSVIIDVVVVLFILFSVLVCMKKGFISSSYKILSLILTVVLMTAFQPVICEYIKSTEFGIRTEESIKNAVNEKLDLPTLVQDGYSGNELIKSLNLPDIFNDKLYYEQIEFTEELGKLDIPVTSGQVSLPNIDGLEKLNDAKDKLTGKIAEVVCNSVFNAISVILLYLIIRIVLFVLFKLINIIFKLPVLNFANKLLGAIAGIVNSLFIIYAICAVLAFVNPKSENSQIKQAIEQSVVTSFLYNNNILTDMFLK